MKLPRDIAGRDLAKALTLLGYETTHQTGSHIRLRRIGGSHHITVPDHKPIKIGTFTAILRDLAAANDMSRDELLQTLKL